MRKLLIFFFLISSAQCTYYNSPTEDCKIEEYQNYDGVEFRRCY